MDSLQNNLIKLLNQDTISFLGQRTGIAKNRLVPAVETVVSFCYGLLNEPILLIITN